MIFVNIYRIVQPSYNPISQPFHHPQKVPCAHPGLPFAGLQGAQPHSCFRGPGFSLLPCTEIQTFHPSPTNQRTQHPESKSQGNRLVSGLLRRLSSKTRELSPGSILSRGQEKSPGKEHSADHSARTSASQWLNLSLYQPVGSSGCTYPWAATAPVEQWPSEGCQTSLLPDSLPLFAHRAPDGHIVGSGEGERGAPLWYQSERKCPEVPCPSRPRFLLSVFPAPMWWGKEFWVTLRTTASHKSNPKSLKHCSGSERKLGIQWGLDFLGLCSVCSRRPGESTAEDPGLCPCFSCLQGFPRFAAQERACCQALTIALFLHTTFNDLLSFKGLVLGFRCCLSLVLESGGYSLVGVHGFLLQWFLWLGSTGFRECGLQ